MCIAYEKYMQALLNKVILQRRHQSFAHIVQKGRDEIVVEGHKRGPDGNTNDATYIPK